MSIRWAAKHKYLAKGGADSNEQAQEEFYKTLTANYSKDFSEFGDLKNQILGKLQPIVNAGPGQYGFDAAQDASIRASAQDADAMATKNAQVAANQQITAANGGAAVMPTGAAEQLREEANVAGAQKLSSDQQKITQAGYEVGRENYNNALSGEEGVMGMMNPNSYAGAATSGGNAATNAVNAAVNADEGWMSMVGGALGGAGSVFSGAGTKLLGK